CLLGDTESERFRGGRRSSAAGRRSVARFLAAIPVVGILRLVGGHMAGRFLFRFARSVAAAVLLLAAPASALAFNCTAIAAGGNWGTAATWGATCNGTIPQTG